MIQGAQISGPATPAEFSKWIDAMKRWRTEYLKSINYSDSEYKRPELLWTQSAFVEPQMMVEDRYFYDPVAGKYTVDRYLDDLQKRYGGIDAVLVWSEYPNLGIDNRNQYDFIRDLPGGVSGVKQMAADFQRRGVHVLFTYNPWDQGTREEGLPPNEAMAKILASVGSEGMNGDTMRVVPLDFRTASDATGRPQVFEPEHLGDDKGLAFNNMGWAQASSPGGAADNVFGRNDAVNVPKVDKLKWLEPRHMTHISDRWQRDKNDDVQYAFFNGLGIMSWESVWGIWNGMTPRDSEIFRRVRKIDLEVAPLLISKDWEPLTPGLLQHGIYASRWPVGGQTLWTIINKNEYDVPGEQLRVPYQDGTKYYDLWHGVELKPAVKDGAATLSFDVEANGYGAVLAVETGPALAGLPKFLGEMNMLTRMPLSSYSKERTFLPQQLVKIASTKPLSNAPAGMVKIPAADFDFQVSGIEIEGSNEIGTDVQYPWEDSPRRNHQRKVSIPSFFIDKTPVTNAEFKKFLDATKYHPKEDHNFLRDWKDGTYPAGWEQKPVTWVSMEDARAYAAWAGKRLPHEWEWQYAAQGTDGRIYPWGNDWNDKAVPVQDKGHELTGPDDVSAHPEGSSQFGVLDTTGNVWQWTDEYLDEHTRAAILRGGSYYAVQGSRWYFPQAYRLNQHGKLLLMEPGKDRAATVGFRCVKDAQ
jgi:formylglycine-generating enzyme required for sulfatase activity